MATSLTTDFPIRISAPVASAACLPSNHRRRITPVAGHALEILGHAIEYLTDEYVHQGGDMSPRNGPLEAVQLLMARNRDIYYACPEVVTVVDRVRAMLHFRAA